MKKTLSLFRILANSAYGISKFRYKSSKSRIEFLKLSGFAILMIFCVLPIIAAYTLAMANAYNMLSSYGTSGVIITSGVVTSCIITLIFGFFHCISVYYFSNDNEYLISLPLKPSQILDAKYFVVLMAEYIAELPLVLPPAIIYGTGQKVGIIYYIYLILALFLIPVIPLCAASIIAIFIMRVTNIGRKRDIYRILGAVFAIIIIIAAEFYLQNSANNGNTQDIMNALFSGSGIINMIARAFPPAAWISYALVQYSSITGFLYFILFIIVSLAFFKAFELLGEMFFFKGYIGSNEANASRKALSEGKFKKEVHPRGKTMAVFLKEFKISNRVPVFFINDVLPIVLVPLIFVMMFFMSPGPEMNMLIDMARNGNGGKTAVLIVTGISLFTSIANMTSSTAISREGAQFFVSKYIPVLPKHQILGKLYHALLITLSGNLLTVITLGLIIKIPAASIILCFIISAIASVSIAEIGLMIDLSRPLLVWDNPQKAVKQNMNGLFSMFLNMLWVGGILIAAFFIIPGMLTACAVLAALFAAVGIILYKVLISYASRRYYSIEP